MRVLVTGATGFIGSHIVDHLLDRGNIIRALTRHERKHKRIPERKEISWIHGDLTDKASLKQATVDISVVYHAAALLHTSDNENAMREVNVNGVKNLLEACVLNQVRHIVFISSIAVYAPASTAIIREDAPLGGQSEYGRTKVEAEVLIKSYSASSKLTYSIIRPCVTYGERDHNFTPRLLRLLRRPVIPVIAGNLEHMIMVHAADVANAAILTGTHPNAIGQAYNITGGRQTSLRELVQVFEKLSGQHRFLVPIPMSLLRTALSVRWLVSSFHHKQPRSIIQRHRDKNTSIFLRTNRYDISKA